MRILSENLCTVARLTEKDWVDIRTRHRKKGEGRVGCLADHVAGRSRIRIDLAENYFKFIIFDRSGKHDMP